MSTTRRADMFIDLNDDPRETDHAWVTSAARWSKSCAALG